MTANTIIDRFREEFIDDTVEPYQVSDTELLNFINDWTAIVLQDVYAFEDAYAPIDYVSDPTHCKLTITSGTAVYSIYSYIDNIIKARFGSATADDLTLITRAEMNSIYPDWEDEASGTPTHLIIQGDGQNKVRLWPTPNTSTYLYLWVYMMSFSTVAMTGTPDIRPVYHDRIFNYLAYRVYKKKDSRLYNPEESLLYKEKWEEDRGEIKVMELRRRQRNGTQPLFSTNDHEAFYA